MVVHQGEDDEVTTASTASANSEAATRAVDLSATATPSLGTPSDSLDRDADPKQMINSTDNGESNPHVSAGTEEDRTSSLNEDSNPEDMRENMTNQSNAQKPPPSYSELKQEAILVDKADSNGKDQGFLKLYHHKHH